MIVHSISKAYFGSGPMFSAEGKINYYILHDNIKAK